MKNNLILTGMMGAGKTYIAKELKKEFIDYSLIDIDELIEYENNMKISEIFEKYSEKYFRNIESKTIENVLKNSMQIISLGGGAFENEHTRECIKQNGISIYLKATPRELYNRIKNETHRPLLKTGFNQTNIEEILLIREKNYQKADIIIDTTKKNAYNIINELKKRLESYAK